jgi:branched-subunit amino acid transport protein
MKASAPSPHREIVVLFWPILAAAALAEVGYLVPWREIPQWWGFAALVLPSVAGAVFFHRYVGEEKKLRPLWTFCYLMGALVAVFFAVLVVAAWNGDAL